MSSTVFVAMAVLALVAVQLGLIVLRNAIRRRLFPSTRPAPLLARRSPAPRALHLSTRHVGDHT